MSLKSKILKMRMFFQRKITNPRIFPLIMILLKVNFLLREIFRGDLNEAISLFEIDVTFKVVSSSANQIASFRFPRYISLERKLTIMSSFNTRFIQKSP